MLFVMEEMMALEVIILCELIDRVYFFNYCVYLYGIGESCFVWSIE